jgi:hypothetical protein
VQKATSMSQKNSQNEDVITNGYYSNENGKAPYFVDNLKQFSKFLGGF